MRHIYHESSLDVAIPVKSWWRDSVAGSEPRFGSLTGDTVAEVAIIGGGYTGLSAAYHLARQHDIKAVVLERAYPGWGASGRNGGFCCMGSTGLGWPAIIRQFGHEEARAFFRTQTDSVALVSELIAAEGIDVDRAGAGEFAIAHKPSVTRELAADAELIGREFGESWTLLSAEALAAHGMAGPEFHGALINPAGFGLNPYKYAMGLAQAATRAGARIHDYSPVTAWRRIGDQHQLHTPGGTVTAKRVLIATNGYTPEDLHDDWGGRLLPALSSIVVTRPLTEAERKAQGWTATDMAFDMRNLLHYFRLLPDGRFLFGGRGGLYADPASRTRQSQRIEAAFHRYFPAWRHVEITHRWSGFVCLARDRLPHAGAWDEEPGVYFALAYHGSGVAMATWAGRAVARLMTGAGDERPAVMRSPPPRFPLPALRPLYLRAAYMGFGLADALA